jgi:hypothetical protein
MSSSSLDDHFKGGRNKMRFMLIVSSEEALWAKSTPQQQQEVFAKYMKFTEDMKKAGVLLAGESLQPTTKGARVSVRNGERTVTNGPFTEPKAAIGGFVLIKVSSKEEAIEWAAKSPGAAYGTMEVREVTEFS